MNNKHVYSPRQSIKLHCVGRGTQCTIFIVCIQCMLYFCITILSVFCDNQADERFAQDVEYSIT